MKEEKVTTKPKGRTYEQEYDIDRSIREKIFKVPLLPQEDVLEKFKKLDAIIYPHVNSLTLTVPYVRTHFTSVISRIASGNTMGRNYFDRDDHEDIGSEKNLLSTSELRVLSSGFSLLRLKDKPLKFSETLEEIGFIRGVFEEAIEGFMLATEGYKKAIEQVGFDRVTPYVTEQQAYVLDKAREIENEVGVFEPKVLYRIVEETEVAWRKYTLQRDEIINPYLRLVYTMAKSCATSDVQVLDNFQNGVLGMVRAVKNYTPGRFAAFALVAKMWIRQSILYHLKSDLNFIKLPLANWHIYQKLEKVKAQLEQETGGEDISYKDIAKRAKMSIEKVIKVYENIKSSQVYSLNSPTLTEEEQNAGSSFAMDSVAAEDDQIESMEFKSEYGVVEEVMKTFGEEERLIFGLVSGCIGSIDEVEFDAEELFRERIRQRAALNGIGITYRNT